jgi:hypothetical protein
LALHIDGGTSDKRVGRSSSDKKIGPNMEEVTGSGDNYIVRSRMIFIYQQIFLCFPIK